MPFCHACGYDVGAAAFCPKCGAAQGASRPPSAGVAPPSGASGTEGIAENVAGLLCYVLGWITGIIFLLLDKRAFVKFHAAQSIVVFGALTVFKIGFAIMSGFGGLFGFGVWATVSLLIALLALILWILLMIKAFQHELFKVPVAADIAETIVGR